MIWVVFGLGSSRDQNRTYSIFFPEAGENSWLDFAKVFVVKEPLHWGEPDQGDKASPARPGRLSTNCSLE